MGMTSNEAAKHVNLEILKEISDGNTDLMVDLINLFIGQVRTFSDQLELYNRKKDYECMAKLAHKIKNSVAMMGIDELSSDMKKLERLAQEGKKTNLYDSFIERFKKISGEAVIELKAILNSL